MNTNLALAIGLSSEPSLYQRIDGLGRPCVSHSNKVLVLAVAATNLSLGSMVGGTESTQKKLQIEKLCDLEGWFRQDQLNKGMI